MRRDRGVTRYLLPDQASIPAHGLPWHIMDYAMQRDAAPAAVARGTGMPGDGGRPLPGTLSSPAQCLQLLANTLRELDSADTSFMLGQQLLPGTDPALAAALRHAASLQQALEILCGGSGRLLPLLRPRLHAGADGQIVLYWSDSHGAPGLRGTQVEMHMTAVVSLARWLGGTRLPWRFCFNRARPRHAEQHQVHFGGELRFDCQLDAMLLDAASARQPWPGADPQACAAALQAAGRDAGAPSLPDALYDYLLAEISRNPTLESASAAFCISPATLKRHLARHGTHFVAELDQVRTHVAMHLFQSRQADNEAVAHYLGFHDAANFRRAFKRWTGLTPALLRAALGA
ncbi:helix-turn-helix domain-containing protein [Pseudoduganella violaceinigra]|uniref:helix-turn-helix domain-containing protein n=1 Tax=Pseudoduganella violaceinigra TaxID=246602 RepID=UPI000429CBE7|nr:AraC family transcriptional regulator [Pseudoduganella violaceinigra]